MILEAFLESAKAFWRQSCFCWLRDKSVEITVTIVILDRLGIKSAFAYHSVTNAPKMLDFHFNL